MPQSQQFLVVPAKLTPTSRFDEKLFKLCRDDNYPGLYAALLERALAGVKSTGVPNLDREFEITHTDDNTAVLTKAGRIYLRVKESGGTARAVVNQRLLSTTSFIWVDMTDYLDAPTDGGDA